MFKNKIIKSLNLVCVVIILIMSSVIPSFADNNVSQDSKLKVSPLNKYGFLKYEDIRSYIQNSTDSETIKVLNEYVTYYYSDDYTIVKDSSGYSKVDFKENGRIFINDKEVESRISYKEITKDEYNLSLSSPLAETTWLPYGNTSYREYNVIGVAPGVLGSLIAGPLGALIAGKIGAVFSILGGAIVGTIAGGSFPEYYLSIKSQSYYKSPITTSRPEIKTINDVYHGPKYNRYQNYWLSHTSL